MEGKDAKFGPPFQSEREVRFAVVMYGGVSLAIYINGVVQELLRLVRATAPENPHTAEPDGQRTWFHDDDLSGSERVYRSAGQLAEGAESRPDKGAPVRTRFVVDILAGTSAGGINAIFLAKALANRQKIDALRDLWVTEGDIAELLNDKRSYKRVGVPEQKPPTSLLNGQRLYEVALRALDGMADTAEKVREPYSPSFAEEIDLTVTTTDLQGLLLPIRLHDRVVPERRHRNTLRFKYSTKGATGQKRNHFTKDYDRLLAFAARCTSSFPFAFEPVQLEDIRRDTPKANWPLPGWESFFSDYADREADFNRWSFADGGYLDNKPFTGATRALRRRRADIPVERKLVYVEPDPTLRAWDPSLPEPEAEDPKARPDAVANVAAAASLPSQETIREDIAAVVARNRVLETMERMVRPVLGGEEDRRPPGDSDQEAPLDDPAYRALRVEVTTNDLAAVIAGATGVQEDSEPFHAVRLLVQSWREQTNEQSLDFLRRFDLSVHLRSVYFLHDRINALLSSRYTGDDPVATWLRRLKHGLNQELTELRGWARAVRRIRTEQQPVPDKIAELGEVIGHLGITRKELLAIAKAVEPQEAANRLVGEKADQLAAFGDKLACELAGRVSEAASNIEALLTGADREDARVIGAQLLTYYKGFERYDAVLLPLTYPELGEARPVEVLRISPDDADSLLGGAGGRKADEKLAGARLGHFGGFLDEQWRRNDLLWGRLDGAERILDSVMPVGPLRDELLEEAQAAIIREELLRDDAGPLSDLMVGALRRVDLQIEPGALLQELDNRDQLLTAVSGLDDKILVAQFRDRYRTPTQLDAPEMLQAAGRGIRIGSDVLSGSSKRRNVTPAPFRWLARVGRLLTGFAELVIPEPGSRLRRRVRRNPLQLALLVAGLLILSGLLGFEAGPEAGWALVGTAVGAAVVVTLTRWLLGGRRGLVLAGAATLTLLLTGLAALEVGRHLEDDVREGIKALPGDSQDWPERWAREGGEAMWPL